jgi:type IV pilus assembly protein PilA
MGLLLVLLVTAALVGCGGGDEEAAPAPAGAPAAGDAELLGMDSAAMSNARNAVSELESCFVTVQTYAKCELPAQNLPVGTGPGQVEIEKAALATYIVAAHSESGATFRAVKGRDYAITRTCEPAGAGGCSADGTW